jgi:adenylate cyclase
MQRAPRKLTVLASLDVAGYTRLVERDERKTLLELARLRRNPRPRSSAIPAIAKRRWRRRLIEFLSVEDGSSGDRVPDQDERVQRDAATPSCPRRRHR